MTKLKVGGLSAASLAAIEPHVQGLYARPGGTALAVIEMEHTERTQPGPRSDKEPQVTVTVTSLEVAAGERAEPVRELLRALYLQRTAIGTLDEDSGQVELAETTIRQTAGMVHAVHAAELTAGAKQWAEYVTKVRYMEKPTVEALLRELQRVGTGLYALAGATDGSKPPEEAPETKVPAQKRAAAKKAPAGAKA